LHVSTQTFLWREQDAYQVECHEEIIETWHSCDLEANIEPKTHKDPRQSLASKSANLGTVLQIEPVPSQPRSDDKTHLKVTHKKGCREANQTPGLVGKGDRLVEVVVLGWPKDADQLGVWVDGLHGRSR